MTDLNHVERWAGVLIEKLAPAERKKLARSLATDLRRSTRERITAQRNPDGSAYAPRRGQAKTGRVRRKAMFQKLRTTKYLKSKYNAKGVSVGFFDRIAKLARVHQFGLRDRIARRGPQVKYERRELLGFSTQDVNLINDGLIEHLTR
ncbi:phage virion morphogenesis protein [Nitrincola iocasae]|uniref:Phage virion morphogenesis protein n=1 Tax=Nitrincola iocasae TaxID=2614693 RepID=A0A5J6LCN2_9GAMM|nr:phage virion morphogenesis protein [Nitrincola iocasae]QEW06359.1 phage virion morphogenesis protein [Nitrincola iocasae]